MRESNEEKNKHTQQTSAINELQQWSECKYEHLVGTHRTECKARVFWWQRFVFHRIVYVSFGLSGSHTLNTLFVYTMRYYERASSNQNIHTQAHIPFAMTKTFYRMEGKIHSNIELATSIVVSVMHTQQTCVFLCNGLVWFFFIFFDLTHVLDRLCFGLRDRQRSIRIFVPDAHVRKMLRTEILLCWTLESITVSGFFEKPNTVIAKMSPDNEIHELETFT